MPWKATDAMKERVAFVLEWERRWNEAEGGYVNVAELCRAYGISRECGHKWIRRYRDAGDDVRALETRSNRPRTSPTAIEEQMQDAVVEARKLHPKWGPRKLRGWLVIQYPGVAWPSASAMGTILARRGLSTPRRRKRRRAPPVTQPFAACDRPNAVWCVDFKGWFRVGDGKKCYPLTITDAYSRYVLRCEVLEKPNGIEVEQVFDSAFLEFGLPDAIRSDNGPPFASTGAGRLTALSVWWMRLGICLERIDPGKPQQNGRHERMHLTLKTETDPQATLAAQQRTFDVWRRVFNEERPHEALGNMPPATVYERSRRHYPRKLVDPVSLSDYDVVRADRRGFIHFRRHKIFISSALRLELLEVEPDYRRHTYNVKFGPILLGRLDGNQMTRGLIIPRSRRQKVSARSLG
jgi:putative transposase